MSSKEVPNPPIRPDDLDRNPDIGQSKGAFATGEDPEELAGVNTVIGDVGNDSTRGDGVPQEDRSRTNK